MPPWSSEAFKVFRKRSPTERQPATVDLSHLHNNSINIQVHTQRSYFPEPPRTAEIYPNSNKCFQLDEPCSNAQFRRNEKLQPLSISYSLPCLPAVAVQSPELLDGSSNHTDLTSLGINARVPKDKDEQDSETKRARRQGMQIYPDDVREELRLVRPKAILIVAKDEKQPPCYSERSGASSSSVYSDARDYEEQITVSSPRVDSEVYEPPSWFSDQSTLDGETHSGYLDGVEAFGPEYLQRIMSLASRDSSASSSSNGPSNRGRRIELHSTKSWETFHMPSVPPSPGSDGSSRRRVPLRDPRLPPADYFSHKEDYDAAAIARFGEIPAEWVQYCRAHHENRV